MLQNQAALLQEPLFQEMVSLGHGALEQGLGPLTVEGSEWVRELECQAGKGSGICWAKLPKTQGSEGTYSDGHQENVQG